MQRGMVAALLVVLAGCANRDPFAQLAGKPDPYAEKRAFTREKAIEEYLYARPIEGVEGIWEWSDKLYEVVIYRVTDFAEKNKYAGYEFVGRITDSPQDQDMRRDVKLLLKQRPDASAYDGLFFGPQGQRYATSFVLSEPGVMQTTVPSGPYGAPRKIQLRRTYPPTY